MSDLERARELLRLHRPKEAAAAAVRHLTTDPTSPLGHRLLALAKIGVDDRAGALSSAEEAVRLSPEDSRSVYVHGFVLARSGKERRALASLRRCIELEPEFASAHDLVARLHLDLNEHRAAASAARRALDLDPQDPDHHATHARVQIARGNATTAATNVANGLRLAPHHRELNVLHGQLELARGDAAGAARSFLGVLRESPHDDDARTGLLDALRRRSRLCRWILVLQQGVARLAKNRSGIVVYLAFVLVTAAVVAAFGHGAGNVFRVTILVLVAMPTDVANVFLLAHPIGKHLLSYRQRAFAVLVALLLLAVGTLLAIGWLGDQPRLRSAAGACGTAALLVSFARLVTDHVHLSRKTLVILSVLAAGTIAWVTVLVTR